MFDALCLQSDVLPAAASMVTRLAPSHRADRDQATCACCKPDAPAWSRMVVLKSADGTQQQLSLSATLAKLVNQLLSVVMGLMAWVEQGREGEEGCLACPQKAAEAPSPQQQQTSYSWQRLSDRLYTVFDETSHACALTCRSLTVLMQAACSMTLSTRKGWHMPMEFSGSGGVAPQCLDVSVRYRNCFVLLLKSK